MTILLTKPMRSVITHSKRSGFAGITKTGQEVVGEPQTVVRVKWLKGILSFINELFVFFGEFYFIIAFIYA